MTASKTSGKTISMLISIMLSTAIIMLLMCLMPQHAIAAGTNTYSLYDSKQKNQQITINKIWNDGLTNDDRLAMSTKTYRQTEYQNLLAVSIMTCVPQSTLRTYQIVFDSNGGSFGTDSNGNSITTNTLTYNAKNEVTAGIYTAPERTDGYTCIGWNTSKTATYADNTATSAVNNPNITNQWLNTRTDKSITMLYAIWKDRRIYYAVMAYGTGIDIDKDGKTMGLTFGPALGYPEFSQYNGDGNTYSKDTTVTPIMTRHHTTADTTIMDETAVTCTDDSHSIITDTDDVGTDSAGNKYRCLHYDNWNTIIYWNKKDPHVYDKCIKKGCSKTVIITPTLDTFNNNIFTLNITYKSDPQSCITTSHFDKFENNYFTLKDKINLTATKQGYGASLVRAILVGADSHTNTEEYYAGTDALTKYTKDSCILSCFPQNLRNAIGYKDLSANSAANYEYDILSNDGICDKLWLFSPYEMNSGGKTIYSHSSINQDNFGNTNSTRSHNRSTSYLRSPYNTTSVFRLINDGEVTNHGLITGVDIAPGFTLSAS